MILSIMDPFTLRQKSQVKKEEKFLFSSFGEGGYK